MAARKEEAGGDTIHPSLLSLDPGPDIDGTPKNVPGSPLPGVGRSLQKMQVDLPAEFKGRRRGRSLAISAEAGGGGATDEAYVPVVIDKSDAAKTRIAAAMDKSFLFSELDAAQRNTVIDSMSEKRVADGDIVIRQGEAGDYFYVIESGTYDVLKLIDGDDKKVFAYDNEGSFGELALMYSCPRAATIKATSAGVLWAVDRVTFHHIIINATRERQRMHEDFLKKVPLLSNLNAEELSKIADCLAHETFAEGECVITEGESGTKLYLLISGECQVTQQNVDDPSTETTLRVMKSGDFFGERALLTQEVRAATVRAVNGDVAIASMDRASFERLLGDVRDVMMRRVESYEHGCSKVHTPAATPRALQ